MVKQLFQVKLNLNNIVIAGPARQMMTDGKTKTAECEYKNKEADIEMIF